MADEADASAFDAASDVADAGSSADGASLEPPPPPMTLDSLPEDIFRSNLWERLLLPHYEAHAVPLQHVLGLFSLSKRMRALGASVDALRLGMGDSRKDQLQLPMTRGAVVRHECALLAPYQWALQFSRLRSLQIRHLSWGGASRLLTLLRAWPQLEELDVQLTYPADEPVDMSWNSPYQRLADELGAVLEMKALPKLRRVFLGSIDRRHCFGKQVARSASQYRYGDDDASRYASRSSTTTPCNDGDDTVVLERLGPTAALWWMAERANHVRKSKLHQWRYELEHGADVHSRFAGRTLLEWMRWRLSLQPHCRAGHREVHRLLVEHGADDGGVRFESLAPPAADSGEDEYSTDYDERVGEQGAEFVQGVWATDSDGDDEHED